MQKFVFLAFLVVIALVHAVSKSEESEAACSPWLGFVSLLIIKL